MNSITLDIPNKLNKKEIIYWLNKIIQNPEILEDILLWISILEVQNEPTISLSEFLKIEWKLK